MTSVQLEDQIRAAGDDALRQLADAGLPVGTALRPPDWARRMLDRLTAPHAARCRHLAERPVQPWYVYAWEEFWRCGDCAAVYAYFGVPALSRAEEFTCDVCRRCSAVELKPSVLRMDIWVVYLGICGGCEKVIPGGTA